MTDLAIRCAGVAKSFGRTQALTGVDLGVRPGTVHAVIGQNGAGKTTLMRIVAGEIAPDRGELEVNGTVSLVRQQFSLVPELTVLENVILGAEPRGRLGRIDWRAARTRIDALMTRTGLDVPLDAEATRLPAGLQQRTEILAALFREAEVVLLDEPTAYLTPHEVDILFETVRGLSGQGLTVVFISHRMREVAENCDTVTVLWQGRTAGTYDRADGLDLHRIGTAVVGGEEGALPEPGRAADVAEPAEAPVVLRALPGSAPLELRAGQILGVAGAAGNGQEELVAHLAGTGPSPALGAVELLGEDITGLGVRHRRERGLRVVPANVRTHASAPSADLLGNLLTSEPPRAFRGRLGTLRRGAAARWATDVLDTAGIVYDRLDQRIGELSGGNAQRLVLARELGDGARVLVAHEPCRGMDLAATTRLRRRMVEFAHGGGAVLLLTADLDELLEVSDEIVMLHRGTLSDRVRRSEATLDLLAELVSGTAATAAPATDSGTGAPDPGPEPPSSSHGAAAGAGEAGPRATPGAAVETCVGEEAAR